MKNIANKKVSNKPNLSIVEGLRLDKKGNKKPEQQVQVKIANEMISLGDDD